MAMRPAISAALVTVGLLSSSSAFPYGESDADGVPTADERRVHLLTNQVRAAPHQFPGWDTSKASGEARPPVAFHDDLFTAAHFHAQDMATSGCFQHASCDGTPAQQRIQRFFDGGSFAENIALGQRDAVEAITDWMNSTTGHRENILTPTWNVLGTGTATGFHWVQNFGTISVPLPRIVSAADFPRGANLRLAALAFDAGGAVPVRFEAQLGEETYPLSPGVGAPGQRVWETTVPRPAACTALVFELEDASGATTRFPTTGTLLAGAGCSQAYRASPGAPTPDRPVIDADVPQQGCRTTSGSSVFLLFGWLLFIGPQTWRARRRS